MIKELDANVVQKIAAGEVVERPSNVVKELLENSLDANATQIELVLEDAGKKLIQITDNGTGISQEDLPLAIKRHATSKITCIEDLHNIHSLGFRGEALASVCAVSDVIVISKTKDVDIGYLVKVQGERLFDIEPVAAKTGTKILVQDLFAHLPARKKFMKSDATELQLIVHIVEQYCLSNPSVSFTLIHDKKTLLESPAVKTMQEKFAHIHGLDVAKNMTHVSSNSVEGYVSSPTHTRTDKKGMHFFINGRYIRNPQLAQAVLNGYSSLLMLHRYPFCVFSLKLDPTSLDINIHPSKDIIKISNEADILGDLTDAVHSHVHKVSHVKQVHSQDVKVAQERLAPHEEVRTVAVEKPFVKKYMTTSSQDVLAETPKEIETSDGVLTYIGIVKKTYIAANHESGLILIDFHAAHERFLYEKFKNQYSQDALKTQTLLEPILVEISVSEMQSVDSKKGVLEKIGVHFDVFGQNTLAIRSLPQLLGKQLQPDDIIALLEQIDSGETDLDKRIDLLFATMGCRAAYKAGDDLSEELAKRIVRWLYTSEQKYSCPHGRPIFIEISDYELEKLFKRKV